MTPKIIALGGIVSNLSVAELACNDFAVLVIPDILQSDPKLSIESIVQVH